MFDQKYVVANLRCGHPRTGMRPQVVTELRPMPDGGLTILRRDKHSREVRSSVILFPEQVEVLRSYLEQPAQFVLIC